MNILNINVAHLKVKVDFIKLLPTFDEIERENGDLVPLSINYPWTPPTCPSCKEIVHLEALCPNGSWEAKSKASTSTVSDSAPLVSPTSDTVVAPAVETNYDSATPTSTTHSTGHVVASINNSATDLMVASTDPIAACSTASAIGPSVSPALLEP